MGDKRQHFFVYDAKKKDFDKVYFQDSTHPEAKDAPSQK